MSDRSVLARVLTDLVVESPAAARDVASSPAAPALGAVEVRDHDPMTAG